MYIFQKPMYNAYLLSADNGITSTLINNLELLSGLLWTSHMDWELTEYMQNRVLLECLTNKSVNFVGYEWGQGGIEKRELWCRLHVGSVATQSSR